MKTLKRSCKLLCLLSCIGAMLLSCSPSEKNPEINIIPQPVRLEQSDGFFKANPHTVIGLPGEQEEYRLLAGLLNQNISLYTGTVLEIVSGQPAGNAIRFVREETGTGNPESYLLNADASGVTIRSETSAGLFYGLQTLLQLLRTEGIPYVSVKDEPRFRYRGMHLDVSRHFFPKEFVLKLLDLMAFYKLNIFHWHLTDGAGWRIQLDSYPRLTSDAAFRDRADWKAWWNGDRKYVSEGTFGAYGGYYTKEDIREVVAYATAKHITVIPEIEMPGHSEEVFVAYPELSCSGKPYVNSDFCVGNEKTFAFVEDVLTEVMELFPSEYIHIGGDEAGKTAWKTCPKCLKRMQDEGLQHVDELQSYMIRRVGEFLQSKGRKLLGWDEILEGGLAPGATVMSWRGEEGAVRAAKAGHDAVLTPGGYLYFDFYQADPATQPEAIGGYTPVKRVYGYEPVPSGLSPEEATRILGVQSNLWTEYIPDEQQVEYMLFPRLLALSEIAWSAKEARDWQGFKPRLNRHVDLLRRMGVNAFPLSYELEAEMEVDTVKREIRVFLDAEKYPAEIRYTTDGSDPGAISALYDSLIVVKDSAVIRAAIFENGEMKGRPTEKKVDYHRGIGKQITYLSKLYDGYMAGGTGALLDGYRGGFTYLDGRWQGYTNSLDAVVDMGEPTVIRKVSARFMQLTGPGVYQPAEVELLVSEDGRQYVSCGRVQTEIPASASELAFQEYTFAGEWNARYVRLKATEANGNQFIFTDEIVIW